MLVHSPHTDSDSSSSSPDDQPIPSHAPRGEEAAASEGDKRWRALLFSRPPHLCMPIPISSHPFSPILLNPTLTRVYASSLSPANLPEVSDPPATFTGSHAETPHMLRLRSEYIRRNPQVWRTGATPEDATREDVEGFYARWITRPD